MTFGLSILIQNGLLEVFSADSRSLPGGGIETASFQLTEHLAVGTLPLIIFITALVLTAALQLLFARTALGRAFRATSDDQQAAQLMGINNRHIYALATAVAFATIAVSGVFLALRTTIAPTDGPAQLLYGVRSCHHRRPGIHLGNFRRGHDPGRGAGHRLSHGSGLGCTGWPCGFSGGTAVQAHWVAREGKLNGREGFSVQRRTRASQMRRDRWRSSVAALTALPWWGGSDTMRLFVEFACFLVLAQMWNLLAGYGGLVSVGQQAYLGLGGYALVVLANKLDVNPFLAVPLAGPSPA